jgi:hypothetical protein
MAAKSKSAKHYDSNDASRKKKSDYDKKYAKRTVSDRVKRNKARRKAEREGRVKKGDGKDVHHSNGINSTKTRVMSASKNRGINEKSRKKGYKQKKK